MMHRTPVSAIIAVVVSAWSATLAAEVSIQEYLDHLRAEFLKLNSSTGKDQLPLYVGPIQVELTVAVTKEAEAGVKFYVIEAGGTYNVAETQKLSFVVNIGDPKNPWMASMPMPPGTMKPPIYTHMEKGFPHAQDPSKYNTSEHVWMMPRSPGYPGTPNPKMQHWGWYYR